MNELQMKLVAAVFIIGMIGWLVIYSLLKMRKTRSIDLRDALLTVEELEAHAKRIALEHDVSKNRNHLSFPIPRMNDNYNAILSVYKSLNEDVVQQRSVSSAAEWLLDNFYVIEEQVKGIRLELNMEEYHRLPILKSGPMKGYTRVYAIAMELVSHSDGLIEEEMLLKYLSAYQSHSILFNREIWMIPTMIRLALIENVRMISQKIKTTRIQWQMADDIVDDYWIGEVEQTDAMIQHLKSRLDALSEDNPSFIEHLFYRLRRSGKSYITVLRFIDEILEKYDTTTEALAQKEHNIQAVGTVAIGNCVISLKYVSTHNWEKLFETVSYVEQILRKDPNNVYARMDEGSRNHYRIQIEKMAKTYRVSELHIAREAVAFATRSLDLPDDDVLKQKKCHVGYYLVSYGISELEERQKGRISRKTKLSRFFSNQPGRIYVLFNLFLMSLLIAVALWVSYQASTTVSFLTLVLTGLAVAIPVSEIAISLTNWIVVKVQKPTVFVKLELKDGIPDEMKTIVVIPAILSDEKRVAQLIETMENHYISNSEKNLYFALVGAFKDFGEVDAEDDVAILQATFEGILDLNHKYAKDDKEIFYFYHRIRKFNENDGNWTGWERKRGALMEFNDILLGSEDTSFNFFSNVELPATDIKYVITLDADTLLPMGMAKKMIGTMAHPLNVPIIDREKGIVTHGHGLMQPRVSFDVDSSNRSIFSRVYTGQEGIDPYASAISDVYQDLFDEGIFTGKGIYDLNVFQEVLKDTIPNNAVLSHDLLEGSYVRAALVNDLELVDTYPSRYNAYITRMYRWIRGDWQLLPWLGKQPYNGNNERSKNALSMLSRWKIIDNLRRSLVSIAIIVLLILGFSILPGSALFWVSLALITLTLPLLMALTDRLFSGKFMPDRVKRHIGGFFGLKASVSQLGLRILFIAYQSTVALSAIFVTLNRVLFTKKNMLEWVTSADAEKGQDNSLKSYFMTMRMGSLIGILLVGLSYFYKPSDLPIAILFFILWSIAPWVAYRISNDDKRVQVKLSDEDVLTLRLSARKTWRYFEEFSNPQNNHLAPDNYQEDPPRGIAFRTSPTDIGLGMLANLTARDFGYISTLQLKENLEKTVKTIQRMEKWQGHLYNWYDTRTLKPLHPVYISTVDNGNYVCYLITLVQGLKSYAQSPMFDASLIQGINDTLMCGQAEHAMIPKELAIFDDVVVNGEMNLIKWRKSLKTLAETAMLASTAKQPWRFKVETMIKTYLNEIEEYSPWLGLIENPGIQCTDEASIQALDRLTRVLTLPIRLEDAQDFFTVVFRLIETLETHSAQDETAKTWLSDLKLAMMQSHASIDRDIRSVERLIQQVETLSWETKFGVLYEPSKQLFSIGYHVTEQKLTNSYYDLFASESRQTSFIAISRGEIPPKHWFMLGRSLTLVNRYKGLVSWSGTMFEYLMPLLIMKNFRNTLLDETYSFVIKSQMKYGKQRGMPWGTSESGYNVLDSHMDYQYKAIGVPWLGLKRGLIEDAVCAPYATFLALMVAPIEAMKNIRKLQSEGIEGAYGFYEAADYTPERLGFEPKRSLIKSYMAHHQGMSLTSINNLLNQNIMQERFHSDPYVKAGTLLLQEKVPLNVVFTKETKEKIIPLKESVFHESGSFRKFNQPDFRLPNAHILSNGFYSVMLSDKGTGYSKDKLAAISRYREDAVLDQSGMFIYLKEMTQGKVWSSAYAPINALPQTYEVTFTPDKATYRRIDHQIETLTEIIVTSGDHAEIRKLSLKNRSDAAVDVELTSYFEVVLGDARSDLAHPAFSNLFIETEYDEEKRSLIANRRPRSTTDNRLWLATTLVSDQPLIEPLQYETDRLAFIGRNRDLANPLAMLKGKPLTNTIGPVLDPIFSLRAKVSIEPGKSVQLYYVTTLAQSKESLLTLIDKYRSTETCSTAFWLALTRSQMENRYLNIKPDEMQLYQEMISNILYPSPLRRNVAAEIRKNKKGQADLWPYGISGDKPIVLVTLSKVEEVSVLYEVMKAHDYWRLKDLLVDLVILVNEEKSYLDPLATLIGDIVLSRATRDSMNRQKDVFILNSRNLGEGDLTMFRAIAKMEFTGDGRTMEEQILSVAAIPILRLRKTEADPESRSYPEIRQIPLPELRHFNGLGGFSGEGDEYVIRLEKDQTTPAPWSNVVANPNFGFITSESGVGYTWSANSRENKITPFSNDAVGDRPGEILYISDESSATWTITPQPIREESAYTITHGFGYTQYEHPSHGIDARMIQFVPLHDKVKLSAIRLHNHHDSAKTITLTYYVHPVMGVDPSQTASSLVTDRIEDGPLIFTNHTSVDFKGKIGFIGSSSFKSSVTGDRDEFFGTSGLKDPQCLQNQSLSNTVGAGMDPCAAMQVNVTLEARQSEEVIFMLGMGDDREEVLRYVEIYQDKAQVESALTQVKAFWKEKLHAIQVKTPDSATDLLLNGWLQYQTIACRLWGRSSFYQSGGAFGFRDQLQDVLAIATTWPEIAREQILKHAAHQFIEGDVLHWWHEPTGKGTRTRISDDLLWLPYVTAEYIRITGDRSILEVSVPFLSADILSESEDERYCQPALSQLATSLFDHCERALRHAMKFGERGLPLIGTGDWNDGMNTVGNKGKGESVWLGWFMSDTLTKFTKYCCEDEPQEKTEFYTNQSKAIIQAIEANAWDGEWYRRAYFDDGNSLGSSKNRECRIDSLSQSWATISGLGDPNRARTALDAMENNLVVRNQGLIKLLTPPFDQGESDPGYIKGYLPGVRENGGQYTHAAAWAIMAKAKSAQGDEAWEWFDLVNPINHTRNLREYSVYKVEPYVLSADVYSEYPHQGRGGWSWYTGSAGWMYRAGIESILGFQKNGDTLTILPNAPRNWREYEIIYTYLDTTYEIKILNPDGLNRNHHSQRIDGVLSENKPIILVNDKAVHRIEIISDDHR